MLVNIFLVQDMHICAGRKKTSSSANARLFLVSNMLLKDPFVLHIQGCGFLNLGDPPTFMESPKYGLIWMIEGCPHV